MPQDIADALVEWISEGKTLRSFCRQNGMPSKSTIHRWRADDQDFAGRVARAKDEGFESLAEECLEIADTQEPGEIRTVTPDGETVKTEDMLGHRKLRVDTRLKLLACWDPRRYGNKGDGQTETAEALAKLVLQQIDGARSTTPLGSEPEPAP